MYQVEGGKSMDGSTYFIAECGQNHNGDIMIARDLIGMAATPIYHEGKLLRGVNAVKFTKRDLSEEMTDEQWSRPYSGPHAFGKTYGEHRQVLELLDWEHLTLYQYAKNSGLDFIETCCSPGAVQMITNLFKPDFMKVASRDIDNWPLLEEIAGTGLPVIISTGMATLQDIKDAISFFHSDITILHCLSQYPQEYKNSNLRRIDRLKDLGYRVGYSDHTTGILAPSVAVALGAEVIEKHITLDRGMKGRDHAGSLAPDGLLRCVRDVRNTEMMLGSTEIDVHPAAREAAEKLMRSICSGDKGIRKGHKITFDDISYLSPGDGFRYRESGLVIGHIAKVDIPPNTIIREEMIDYE
jgi:sialic acid synthase